MQQSMWDTVVCTLVGVVVSVGFSGLDMSSAKYVGVVRVEQKVYISVSELAPVAVLAMSRHVSHIRVKSTCAFRRKCCNDGSVSA